MPTLALDAIASALQSGDLSLTGQFVQGSNYTFLASCAWQELTLPVVYKPIRGERPLWDFPERSLAKREAAASLVSDALGWQLVPPTIYRRRKMPLGPGSIQLYIDHDPQKHYFNLDDAGREQLKPVAIFDILLNNADRKGSHVLLDAENHLWAIDQGLCFHTQPKLRTVIWDFAGQPMPTLLLQDVTRLMNTLQNENDALRQQLLTLLRKSEINALIRRASTMLENPVFPHPSPHSRPYPWPLI